MTNPALYDEALATLRRLVGSDTAEFHDGQYEAIEALVADQRRALVVQRTGWGKSAVYFVATALLRARGAGPTLIISPLIALMRDQVAAAQRAGLRAVAVNSANATEWEQVQAQLAADEVDILQISPERLNHPGFRQYQLPDLIARMGLLVVDEAHCISDWGHDFRPDYRRIKDLIGALETRGGGSTVPILATTATANQRVVDDVAVQLGGSDVYVLRGPLARSSLQLGVHKLAGPMQQLAWLTTHLNDLPGSGIIYALTVSAAEDTAQTLREAGYAVQAYTGRTDSDARQQIEGDLKANRLKAVVATSALGMGFDKPDLGFVVHLGAPNSPVAYYQQVGRAGRGVDHAEVLLLPGPGDRDVWQYFATASIPDQHSAETVLTVLQESREPLSVPKLETSVNLRRTQLEMLLKVLAVDGAVVRESSGWRATGVPWTYDHDRYQHVLQQRVREENLMLDYENTTMCRMRFLAEVLDDPHATDCGRCDNCAGVWFPADYDPDQLEYARAALSQLGSPIEPRKQWPTGLASLGLPLKGKIPAEQQALEGRAIGRLTDLGWGTVLRPLIEQREDTSRDQPAPQNLLDAVVKLLSEWDWDTRPIAVVAVPSAHRPQLVRSVAQHISQIGQLPYLGELELPTGPPQGGPGGNSAYRFAAVHGKFRVPEQMAHALHTAPDYDRYGPILLVDDLVDSRWTLTECARVLREAGAQGVLPLALAIAG